jgi:hypothetical protein
MLMVAVSRGDRLILHRKRMLPDPTSSTFSALGSNAGAADFRTSFFLLSNCGLLVVGVAASAVRA